MDALHVILGLVALAGIGGVVFLLLQRNALAMRVATSEEAQRNDEAARTEAGRTIESLRAELRSFEGRIAAAQAESARLKEAVSAEQRLAEQKLADAGRLHTEKLAAAQQAQAQIEAKLREFDQKLQDAFGRLAADALKHSSQQFLALAEQKLNTKATEAAADMDRRRDAVEKLVKPIADTLLKTDEKLAAMEKERTHAYAGLAEQVRAMQSEGSALRVETSRLVKALREPHIRGRYGEIQLKRVAELAGLRSYCDFIEQSSAVGDDGQTRRPDMIIKLPNGRELVVDAKANLKPYLDALEASTPDDADAHMVRFADGIADQARKLSRKGYYADYQGSAEITVMFVPGDQFVDAALSKRPDLLDFAAAHNVILASPSSLIALLRAVAVGFREARLAEEANQLLELGRTLHERASVAMEHVVKLGRSLEQAVGRYNDFVSSYESRLEPTLRQFETTGVKSAKELPSLEQVTLTPKTLTLPEVVLPDNSPQKTA